MKTGEKYKTPKSKQVVNICSEIKTIYYYGRILVYLTNIIYGFIFEKY